jgi:hypothetical protein
VRLVLQPAMGSTFLKARQSLDDLGAREVLVAMGPRRSRIVHRRAVPPMAQAGVRIAPRIRACRSSRRPRVRIAIREWRFEALQRDRKKSDCEMSLHFFLCRPTPRTRCTPARLIDHGRGTCANNPLGNDTLGLSNACPKGISNFVGGIRFSGQTDQPRTRSRLGIDPNPLRRAAVLRDCRPNSHDLAARPHRGGARPRQRSGSGRPDRERT